MALHEVRFAVHYNLKQQPQVSFVDRLNNRAEAGPKGAPGACIWGRFEVVSNVFQGVLGGWRFSFCLCFR